MMRTAPIFGMLVIAVAVALLAVGLPLFLRGWRGGRRGNVPHCRTCNYALVGLWSKRCPECGTDLDGDNVVAGERVRRPLLAAAGGAAVLLALVVIGLAAVGAVRQVNWYALRPASWLAGDLASTSAVTSRAAWQELMRRERAGELPATVYGPIAEVALGQQAADTPGPLADDLVEWLGRAVADGRLSQAQVDRFFRQAVRLDVRVRPEVVLGDPVPYELSERGRVPSRNWWVSTGTQSVSLDGKPVGHDRAGGSFSGMGTAGSTTSTLAVDRPGPHAVSATVRVRVFHGPRVGHPDDPANRLAHEADVTASANFEVLAEEPTDYLKPLRDPGLAAAVRASVHPGRFSRGAGPGDLVGVVVVDGAPANLAFDVIARAGGREYPIASLNVPTGTSTSYHLSTNTFGDADAAHFDLVLRASAAVARRTVDLTEYWDGELVFERLPVAPPPPPSPGPEASEGPTPSAIRSRGTARGHEPGTNRDGEAQ